MNNIIYQWLYNSHNNNNNNDDKSTSITITTTLIECILILSINNLQIHYDNIIQYYYNVIQYQQQQHRNNEEITILLNGLNQKQFQVIHDNINSLKHLFLNEINKAISPTPPTTNNINHNDEERINKIKFEYSIFLITQNNIKNNHIQSSLEQQKQQNYNKTELFIKIWRNLVIRNEILYHTRLFNIHLNNQISFTPSKLSTYKFKDYIDEMDLALDDEFIIHPNSLPPNLRKLILIPLESDRKTDVLLKPYGLPDSLTTLEFQFLNISNEILCHDNLFPNSITHLTFYGLVENSIKQVISKSWLPNSLKYLEINGDESFKQTIGQLPESLTELKLDDEYNGIVEAGTIPTGITNYFLFNSNGNTEILNETSIPKSTIHLEFDEEFKQNIKLGDIPDNVKSITFHLACYINIEKGSLPISLLSLSFGQGYYGVIGGNVLPSNLTYVDIPGYNRYLIPNMFPISIKTIKLQSFNQPIPIGYFINHINLTTLEIDWFEGYIPPRTLPPSLTFLKIYTACYNGSITKIFPQSLSKLELNGHSQIIPGTLPSSITSLTVRLDKFPLVAGSLPCNLKELHIKSIENQHLSVDGIIPDSLQHIYIPMDKIDYINSWNTDFVLKYIRFLQ